MQNASYLANFALEGISGIFSLAVGFGQFADGMPSGIGSSSSFLQCSVGSVPFSAVLASGSADPSQIGIWVIILFLMLNGAVAAKKLWSKSPTHAELATKEELGNTKEELGRELGKYVKQSQFAEFKTEVRGDMKEITRLIEKSCEKVDEYAEKSYQARKGIHKTVNKIDREQGCLKTRQDEQEKSINKLEDRKHG